MRKSIREIAASAKPGASAAGLVFLSIVSFVLLLLIIIFLTRAFAALVGFVS